MTAATTATADHDYDANPSTSYTNIADMLPGLIRRFASMYPGDVDAYASACDATFLDVHETWDDPEWEGRPKSFKNWLRHKCWYAMLSVHRRGATQYARCTPTDMTECEPVAPQAGEFSLGEFCDRLTDDAAHVVRLCVCTPADLQAKADARGGEPRNLRACVRAYLAECGWSRARVAAAFDRVAQELV